MSLFDRRLRAGALAALCATGLAAQEQVPEPSQTITEDVRIDTQTPSLELHDPTTQPPRSFFLVDQQGGLEIRDSQASQPALTIRHFQLAGGGELTLRGYPISLWGQVGVGGSPSYRLHVRGSVNEFRPLLVVEDGNTTVASRNLFRLQNRGASTFRFDNVETGQGWGFGSLGAGNFFVSATGAPALGLTLTPGGDLTIAGALVQGSSREIKDDVRSVRPDDVLERLSRLPISTWRYKHAPESVHMGPMAQDFAAAFGLGPDDRHVAPADLAAVGLAAAQALQAELAALRAEVEQLRAAQACH